MFLSNELLGIGNLVFPLVISVFIILMIVSTSIAKKVIMKKALVASFLNVFIFIITTIIYNRYIVGNEIFEIVYLALVGLDLLGFIITGYLCFKNAIHKSNEFELIINGVQKTKFNAYYVIDQKDRILEISDSLVEELGAVKEEVIGKKLFDVFDRTIRIKKFNDTEVNNKGLSSFLVSINSRSVDIILEAALFSPKTILPRYFPNTKRGCSKTFNKMVVPSKFWN